MTFLEREGNSNTQLKVQQLQSL